jgi:hypothetical protein
MMNHNRWLQFAIIATLPLVFTRQTRAQEVQVKPWFLAIADTSSTMGPSMSGDLGTNSCGFTQNPNIKMTHAKCALNKLINGTGDALFGLMQFAQTGCNRGGSCDGNAHSGMLLVPVAEGNQNSILSYVDDVGSCVGEELVAGSLTNITWTPLPGVLALARDYFCAGSPGANPACGTPPSVSPTKDDIYAACRPMAVILLTDGIEQCTATPATVSPGARNRASELRTTRIPVPTSVNSSGYIPKDIRTYVIGFGIGEDTDINAIEEIATAGGTDAPGQYKAFYATDEDGLSLAFSQIVADSQLVEICNGIDDDCDGLIDDGFNIGQTCSAGVGACARTGKIGCVSTSASGCKATPAAPGAENTAQSCKNGIDDDCDGLTDCSDPDCQTLLVCRCVAEAEICDNKDNDCDGSTDEDLTRQCGSNVGECKPGTETCSAGVWAGCTGTNAVSEICDNKDNDCDGVTDGYSEPCPPSVISLETIPDNVGECQRGWHLCVAGGWTPDNSCTGAVGRSPEICDNKDNDCDGSTDEDLSKPCNSACGQGVKLCVAGNWGECSVTEAGIEECDGKDNDCDGLTDEDLGGEPCGSGEGVCTPGINRCINGAWVCEGGTKFGDEICDGLDNDCDGVIDDGLGLGNRCGTDVGECKAGQEQCIRAKWVCVGEVGPSKEVCDCKDNDCDGLTDEATEGSLCPGESVCLDCQCVLPCAQSAEFKDMCPSDKAAYHPTENQCYCVGEACQANQCATQTATSSGETKCEPNSSKVGVCVCKNNKCTFPCDGVTCASGLVCDPHDGVCKENSCAIFGCETGERCDPVLRACESDPCATVACAQDQGCREGQCVKSCASVSCGNDQRCVDGVCQKDACSKVTCSSQEACNQATGKCQTNACLTVKCQEGLVCDTLSGECVADPCFKLRCPSGESCQDGTCIFRCPGGQIECGHACVDPRSSLDYCGATLDCQGSNIGVKCASDQVCAGGVCAEECSAGQIKCEGVCVDPASHNAFCGASGDCQGDSAGEKCAEGQVCKNRACSDSCDDGLTNCGGVCIDGQTDRAYCGAAGDCSGDGAGRKCAANESCWGGVCIVVGTDISAIIGNKPDSSVIAAGGGGCACTVTPGGHTARSERWAWAVGLMLLGIFRFRMKKRIADLGRRVPRVAGYVALAGAIGTTGTLLSGCNVNPFCLDCQQDAGYAAVTSDSGAGQPRTGETDGQVVAPTTDGQAATPDGHTAAADGHTVGDGANTCASANFDTDPNNCGVCGHACAFDHAFAQCVAGQCQMNKCDVGFFDLDQNASNGCEYECSRSADDDTSCNQRDDDCDGRPDEDVDLQNDSKNCGICGLECLFAHAPNAGACKNGVCVLDSAKCEPGFFNVDGTEQNGCEYQCKLSDPPIERCNLLDDDCDGVSDEAQSEDKNKNNVTINDGRIGQPCKENKGECKSGWTVCIDGQAVCSGFTGPSSEICDGKDNNCDGETDEGFDLQTDVNNCGSCGHSCVAYNAAVTCQAGTCGFVCKSGWWDNPDITGQDCLYECDYRGNEVCNGRDDDCNGQIDDQLTHPSSFCTTSGVCGVGTPVQPTCQGTSGWVCDYRVKANYQPDETRCDGLDNDCNGVVDFPSLINQPCSVSGPAGSEACQASGIRKCFNNVLSCVGSNNQPISPSTKKQEVCNGVDDDCDGETDEPCAPTERSTGCVQDAWVPVPGFKDVYIYAYEASRPDATDKSGGSSNARACSNAGRMPWTNITFGQAQTACVNASLNAKARLCEEPEWIAACMSGADCTWSYATNCQTYSANTCNGADYDTDSQTAGNQDAIKPTGSMADCYRSYNNSAKVYDLSGNVKEWVKGPSAGVNPLRGGAMNNTKDGIACEFDFTLADDDFLFFNAGFRCCYGP